MKSGEGYKSTRRSFIKGIGAALLLAPLLQSCKEKAVSLLIRMTGTNHILGHRLRAGNFPKPSRIIEIPYLIVGGGITGLSAAREFKKRGIDNFLLLELEGHLGGNSSNGENKYSKFPLGAHYLPLPNFHDKQLLEFLHGEKIITGFDVQGYPEFDEEQLTFSPQERLFIRNTWQEGLVPKYGNSAAADEEFEKFFKIMDTFREAKGPYNKYYFDIPVSASSADAKYHYLDKLTMKQWLVENNFVTEELLEYTNYCCRDDFGLGIDYVSAWAGVHYFAARKHDGTNTKDNVLTWPEGNARLAHHLKKYAEGKTMQNCLAYKAAVRDGKAVVTAFDDVKKESVEIIADKIIMATPQFVNQYLLPERKELAKSFNYAPWVLATLTLKDIPEAYSYPLCWDNVIHKGQGLGYIYDQHQSVRQLQQKKVITYYYSLSTDDLRKARREVYQKPKEYWKQFVMADLKAAHPDIEELTEEIQIHRLGHGMISPVPGFITGVAIRKAAKPVEGKIYFAHSDLSGISIFEEAFHQGINVVKQVLHDTAVDT
jgi:hypothetical protein